VNDNFLHIDHHLNKDYPMPDIPADQAWEEMRKLLDEEDATLVPPSFPPIPPGEGNDYWKYGLLLLIVTGCLLYFHYCLLHKTKTTAHKEDTRKSRPIVHAGDRAISLSENKFKSPEKINDVKSSPYGPPLTSVHLTGRAVRNNRPGTDTAPRTITIPSWGDSSTITTNPIDIPKKNSIDSGRSKSIVSETQTDLKDSSITASQTKKKDRLPNKKTDPAPDSKDERQSRRISLAAGLGLNQFFVIGSQQHSDYSSGGTTGSVSDYIPVPFIRSYLNKKLYVQLEAQINTPQYTKQLLAKTEIVSDTGRPGRPTTESSVFINKLFYFNIPLSIHYSPFNNFYIGAGLQFSQLTNGVGLFEGKQYSSLSPDTLSDSKIASIKNDPVYREIKTNEWRLLMDINYQWKNFILGLRYNQSLSNFINVRISSTELTQGRNSSIQLYLRYILWKNKKTKELLTE
jgi:hypothetical protein